MLLGMKTSMNMEIPSPPTNSGRRSTGGRASSGPVTGHSTGAFAVAGSPAAARQNNGASSTGKGRKRGSKAGQKRKRAKDDSDSSGSDSAPMSGLGEDSDSDEHGSVTELPRMTQSGRAVVKPTQFVPAASEGPSRKRGPTKRTQEHALCKRCGRGHSPASNMIVFCDGCNLGWHQMCHDPVVSNDMVKDESAAWFCADCTLKRLRKGGVADQNRGVSWQGRTIEDVSHNRSCFSNVNIRYTMLILRNRSEYICLHFPSSSWYHSSCKPVSCTLTYRYSHRPPIQIPHQRLLLLYGPLHLNRPLKRSVGPTYTLSSPFHPLQPQACSPALKRILTRL